MSQPTTPTFAHYMQSGVLHQKDFIDITEMAKASGFYFPFTGISQAAYFQAIDVPNRVVTCSNEDLTRQLLKLAWRAARKVPSASQASFTVCKPPSENSVYVNSALDLVLSVEQNQQGKPILIITTGEEAYHG